MRKFLSVALGLFLLSNTAFASSKTPANNIVNISYIQNAQSAQLKPVNIKTGVYTLTLSHVHPYTTYFSERPNRVVGLLNTTKFMSKWNHGPDSFSKDAPNAVLNGMMETKKKLQNINLVMELSNPSYDSAKSVLSYTAHVLKDKQTPEYGTVDLNYVTLFIDSNVCLSCIG